MKNRIETCLNFIEAEIQMAYVKFNGEKFSFNYDIPIYDLGGEFYTSDFITEVKKLSCFNLSTHNARVYFDMTNDNLRVSGTISPIFNNDYTNDIIKSRIRESIDLEFRYGL